MAGIFIHTFYPLIHCDVLILHYCFIYIIISGLNNVVKKRPLP